MLWMTGTRLTGPCSSSLGSRNCARGGYDAFAIRCWPEAFTDYGGAVCGPAAMLGENRVPCACEADVYGALSQLILLEVAQAPVFLTDLVDVDAGDDTAVVWHCGQAPLSMRDPGMRATATFGKCCGHVLDRRTLPVANLGWVHAVLLCKLSQRQFLADRVKRNTGFEIRRMVLSFCYLESSFS